MIAITPLLALLALLALMVPAAAQTSCLDEFTGSVNQVEDTLPDRYIEQRFYYLADGARIDGRGATILQQTTPAPPSGKVNDYPLDVRADGIDTCISGVTVVTTNDPTNGWRKDYEYNHTGLYFEGANVVMENSRIHGTHDGFRPGRPTTLNEVGVAPSFIIRRNWVTYNRDDCVENDDFRGGLIEDNLFDGCYTFLSSRDSNKQQGTTVTLRNNIIRIQQMIDPYGHDDEGILGSGPLFKYQSDSPDLVLENNIILFEDLPTTQYGWSSWIANAPGSMGFRLAQGQLAGCSGNTIVWLGEGPFLGDVPDDPACVTITTDRSIYDDARLAWIQGHPNTRRVPDLTYFDLTISDPFTIRYEGLTPVVVALDGTAPPPDPDPDPVPPPPDPVPPPPEIIMLVGGLSASTVQANRSGSRWYGEAVIEVVGIDDEPLAGVTVHGEWSFHNRRGRTTAAGTVTVTTTDAGEADTRSSTVRAWPGEYFELIITKLQFETSTETEQSSVIAVVR